MRDRKNFLNKYALAVSSEIHLLFYGPIAVRKLRIQSVFTSSHLFTGFKMRNHVIMALKEA